MRSYPLLYSTESEISDTMHPSTMKAQKPEVPRDLSFNSITSHSSSFPETSESNSITRDVDSESPWEDHLEGNYIIFIIKWMSTRFIFLIVVQCYSSHYISMTGFPLPSILYNIIIIIIYNELIQ